MTRRSSHAMRKSGLVLAVGIGLWTPGTAHAQAAPAAFMSAARYDGAGHVTGTIMPDPDGSGPLNFRATRNTYDGSGLLIRIETGELANWQDEAVAPANWAGFTVFNTVSKTYDAGDQLIRETRAGQDGVSTQVTQYSYDLDGRIECTAVRMNAAAWGTTSTPACTPGPEGSFGPDRIAKAVYDDAGQITRVIRAYGTPLQQDYVSYTYTSNGKQATVKDADGNLASYDYDGLDRLIKWSFPDMSPPGAVSTSDYEGYNYDQNNNRTSYRKRDGRVIVYTYDSLNRLAAKQLPLSCVPGYTCTPPPSSAVRSVYFGYDLRGLQLSARFDSDAGADGVFDSYDGFGRLVSEVVSMNGISRIVGYVWDGDGNRKQINYPDGNHVKYSYDGLDRMIGIRPNSVAIAAISYDAQARPSTETRNNVLTTFGYDAVSRLSTLTDDLPGTPGDVVTTFAYSPANQLSGRTRSNNNYAFTGYISLDRAYTVNGLNQYVTAGPANFAYDANGNLTSDATKSFIYDAENRLVATADGTALTYDATGRLYSVTTPTTAESYTYAGDQRIGEYNGNGLMTARYVPGAGEDKPLIWYEGSSMTAPRALQSDAEGSITSIVDSAGVVLAYNNYDEYGIPGAGNVGRYQYSGQIWMPQIGMYYYKARIYSPTLGRFMQTDPIGYKDQMNLYAYVDNDPMNRVDPTGLSDISLFSKGSDRLIARREDSWMFDIFGHGGSTGIRNQNVANAKGFSDYNPDQLYAYAHARGYVDGTTTFLLSCSLGYKYPGQAASFAQTYADRSKGPVVAADGYVTWANGKGTATFGWTDDARYSFSVFSPSSTGRGPIVLGDGVRIDKDKSVTFFRSDRHGSSDRKNWTWTATYHCTAGGQCSPM